MQGPWNRDELELLPRGRLGLAERGREVMGALRSICRRGLWNRVLENEQSFVDVWYVLYSRKHWPGSQAWGTAIPTLYYHLKKVTFLS